MRSNLKWTALAAAAALHSCAAQTYTDCNPTEETCSADTGLAQWSFTTDFTSGDSAFDSWNVTSGSVPSTSLGAAFTINEQGDAPTIETDFYIFFGYVEVKMRAANGTGIISTAILESDDLDEIDWEQISTFDDQITTNYFGKGNTTSYDRATTVSVSNPSTEFHTYGISWTASKTEWYVDGTLVRTLNYADAVDGTNYPQTPMRVRIGIWAGGDPDNSEGTIEWAGGETDYTAGPFTMYVESVSIINYNPAESKQWHEQWELIRYGIHFHLLLDELSVDVNGFNYERVLERDVHSNLNPLFNPFEFRAHSDSRRDKHHVNLDLIRVVICGFRRQWKRHQQQQLRLALPHQRRNINPQPQYQSDNPCHQHSDDIL
ncbi:concanavalin A-like lectin/glucanase domain-containing protein [Aspergillus recurvatus]